MDTSSRRSADHRLLALVGCIRGIVLEFDGDARYLNAWSDDVALLARPPEELVSKSIDEVLGDAIGAPFTAQVKRVYATGVVEHAEYPLVIAGVERWFFADVKRVGTPETGFTVVFFARDITERRRTEQALERSEERFRLAASATNDVLWDWDLVADTVTWAPMVGTVLGYADVSITNAAWWLDRIHPEDAERVRRSVHGALEGDASSWSDTYRFRRADGGYSDFVDRGHVVRGGRGEPLRMVGSMVDVTRINRLQAQLLQADRLAALGLLAAGVGHEINNPLSYVLGNVDLALEAVGADAGEVRTLLEEARDGARRITEIVKTLRLFGGRDDAPPGRVDVRAALERSLKMVNHEIRHRAALVRKLDPVPPVVASESQLVQALVNILVNAAHAIEGTGRDHNEIRVVTRAAPDGFVELRVEDTGKGIAPEDLGRVFDPFFTTKPFGVGTGLGLSICHGIMEKLGGSIAIESDLGRGTTVILRIPGAVPAVQAERRVLVIDDDPNVGRLVERILRHDAEIVRETSARDALERLSCERFDVVLCDVMMPQMSGIELYDVLRERMPELVPRIFFMTGGAFTARAREFLERIGDARIDKPLDAARLRALLRETEARAA